MKILCDVCHQSDASVYCSADEAALCSACDHRVHHANKLAGKHPRFSLLTPAPKDSPLCDICQDKKAFLFCQQDRAILCQDCDLAIHKVNPHTLTHSRFLLTGVKLSPTAVLYSSPPSTPPSTKNGVVPSLPSLQSQITSHGSQTKSTNCHQESKGSGFGSVPGSVSGSASGHGSVPGSGTSSISEYLIETLPGWHVEDFLDPTPDFSTGSGWVNDPGPVWGGEVTADGSLNLNTSFSSTETMGIWVPQAPHPPVLTSHFAHMLQPFEPGSSIGFGDQTVNGSSIVFGQKSYCNGKKSVNGGKGSRNLGSDYGNCFMVPQISPSSTSSKRSRTVWQ